MSFDTFANSCRKVNQALKDQMEKLWHTTSIYMQPKIYEYAERLSSKLPGDLNVVYFVNSGSEANDLALLMARLYTKNYDVLTLKNAYHGASTSTMGLTGICSVANRNNASGKNIFNLNSSAIIVAIPACRRQQWYTSCYECRPLLRSMGREELSRFTSTNKS